MYPGINLLADGTAADNSAPSSTSLGRIGIGIGIGNVYTDFQLQITYTNIKVGRLQFTAGAIPRASIAKRKLG